MTDAAHESAVPLTLFEKIWRQHRIGEERNGTAVLAVDRKDPSLALISRCGSAGGNG